MRIAALTITPSVDVGDHIIYIRLYKYQPVSSFQVHAYVLHDIS